MPRTARVVIPGCVHHVTQRGNNRQDVFFVEADRQVFLQYLREAAGSVQTLVSVLICMLALLVVLCITFGRAITG